MKPAVVTAAQHCVRVDLGERAYDIVIGDGLVADVGQWLAPIVGERRLFVVSDGTVDSHYGDVFTESLRRAGLRHSYHLVAPGEGSKSFDVLEELCETLIGDGLDRRSVVVALGGGVIGDLAGFAAGVVMRGVDFIQVPTTLLAQVDSAVGGKTGINIRRGKNLVGLFHQPILVLADVGVLDTLDPRQLRAGYAEVVKYGLIEDAPFFTWLEENGAALLAGDRAARTHAVMTSCQAKAAVVAADEREAGQRALLNLGHTFGHALEAEFGFSDALLHGEGVAVGMVLAFSLSAHMGWCGPDRVDRILAHLRSIGLPAAISDLPSRTFSAETLIAHMQHDKKATDGRIAFVVARDIGHAFVSAEIPPDVVTSFLRNAIESP
jgi:3-dehydroquinate synthase